MPICTYMDDILNICDDIRFLVFFFSFFLSAFLYTNGFLFCARKIERLLFYTVGIRVTTKLHNILYMNGYIFFYILHIDIGIMIIYLPCISSSPLFLIWLLSCVCVFSKPNTKVKLKKKNKRCIMCICICVSTSTLH